MENEQKAEKVMELGGELWIAGAIMGAIFGYQQFGIGGGILLGLIGVPVGWIVGTFLVSPIATVIENWEDVKVFSMLAVIVAGVISIIILFWGVK